VSLAILAYLRLLEQRLHWQLALFLNTGTLAPFSTNLCAERMSLDMIVACGILHGRQNI
jgi:hypothetical protein